MHGHFGLALDQLVDDLDDVAILRPGPMLIAAEVAKQSEIFVKLHGPASIEHCAVAVANWWDKHYPPTGGHAGVRSAALVQAILAHIRFVGGGGS